MSEGWGKGMNWDFTAWWQRDPHHWKYTDDHPAYLAAQEAWSARDAEIAALRAVQPCGHPVSFLLHSAETGEPLYCEACDDKSGRRDAEARETELQAANAALRAEVERLRETKDGAYLERNRCVALIARMALTLGLRAGLARTAIEGWSEDWHGCVYIDLPTGQCSWHFHDSQAHLFYGLPTYAGKWDGHTTPEKYGRVDAAMR